MLLGDRNDDSILEKGNRRKKRWGDRTVFRGGTNRSGATFAQPTRVKERDAFGKETGNYLLKTVSRRANLGIAAQVQRMDLVSQILEAKRDSLSVTRSVKEVANIEDKKALRADKRDATLEAMKDFFQKASDDLP